MEQLVRTRKETPELGWGAFEVLPAGDPAVLALRHDWRGSVVLTVHNLADRPAEARLEPAGRDAGAGPWSCSPTRPTSRSRLPSGVVPVGAAGVGGSPIAGYERVREGASQAHGERRGRRWRRTTRACGTCAAVELASAALAAGDEPFGSVLVAADGTVLFEDHNHVASGDQTRHPEFEIARWAAANLDPAERAATVCTSGSTVRCAAAHGWVGLGASSPCSSSSWPPGSPVQGVPPPVRTLPIREVVPGVPVEPGPRPGEAVHDLHRRFHQDRPAGRPPGAPA